MKRSSGERDADEGVLKQEGAWKALENMVDNLVTED
jgi:hypothetical protein